MIGVAALLSTMGNYNGSLMSASRALWAMGRHRSFDIPGKEGETEGEEGGKGGVLGEGEDGFKMQEPEEEFTMIWPVFGQTYEKVRHSPSPSPFLSKLLMPLPFPKYGTPMVAIIFYSCTTAVLMFFQFSVLVEVTTFCQCVGLIFEFAAFLYVFLHMLVFLFSLSSDSVFFVFVVVAFPSPSWLRYREPNTPRPYEVPGGMIGAWAISISALFFLFATVLSMFFTPNVGSVLIQMGIFFGINIMIGVSYAVRKGWFLPFPLFSFLFAHWQAFTLTGLKYYHQREILKHRGVITMVRHTKLQT
jgi:amino acid transporter